MKHALITFGNEESYGLSFVGGELLEKGEDFRFFENDIEAITEYKPDFAMFSPMTVFFPQALATAMLVKKLTKARTVFGGHHVFASPVFSPYIDSVVTGPVRGSIEKIHAGQEVISTNPTTPADLPFPARKQYFKDIPRIAKRYRKFVLSMLGCPWNCSYCSSSSGHVKDMFGDDAYKKYYLKRRPIGNVLAEVRDIMKYDTEEIQWVDDDVFAGDEGWMLEFLARKPKVPMYVSTTSVSALKASDRLLRAMKDHVNVIGMGVQAIRPESLKLFNRQWDSEWKMKSAYARLRHYGFKVNLQAIIGLPIDDPVEDAIETVKGLQRIGAGSVCSIYPLMIYPGTKMDEICGNLELNDPGDTSEGICDIKFGPRITKQLMNICKLGTMFVKYNIDEHWMRALINIDYDDETSQNLSMVRYRECVIDRLGKRGKEIFNDIIGSMRLKF